MDIAGAVITRARGLALLSERAPCGPFLDSKGQAMGFMTRSEDLVIVVLLYRIRLVVAALAHHVCMASMRMHNTMVIKPVVTSSMIAFMARVNTAQIVPIRMLGHSKCHRRRF